MLPKSVKLVLVSALCSVSAVADTYILKSELSGKDIDWTSLDSYSGSYSRNPAENDIVEIPADMVAKITVGSSSWDLVNDLDRVIPRAGAVLEVSVPLQNSPEERAVLRTPVAEYGLDGASDTGTLRKKGAGTLELASYGAVVDKNQYPKEEFDYCLNIDVVEGHLHFYAGGTDSKEKFRFKDINVSEGATLHICYIGTVYCNNLNGEGFITLDNTVQQGIFIEGNSQSSYGGWMTGPIRIDITKGRHDITCPTNTINTICFGDSGICGFTRLGTNNSVPSSLGTGNFNFGSHSGIIYLGTESGTSSKTFWIHSNSFVDAGAFGGLTFSGKFDSSGDAALLRKFTITGSNQYPCVISGPFPSRGNQENVFYLKKTGTGTWRMAGDKNVNRGSLGVIDVEDGTLQFESIAEKGEPCSLGFATNLFQECVHVAYNNGVPVDYAMILGGNGTQGTLEYVGSEAAECSTRPIAVRSTGRFKNSGGDYKLSNVYAYGTGDRTLVLDASVDTGYGNIATKVSDGTEGGKLSVVKEGDGVWQLADTNTFTGSLISREGTLLINNPSNKYKWYRFVVMENAYSCPDIYTEFSKGTNANGSAIIASAGEKELVQISHIALYNADGSNIVHNFKQRNPITQFAFDGGDARVMKPGEVAIGQLGKLHCFTDISQELENLFDKTGYPAVGGISTGKGGINKNDPSTWVPFVVRLPDDAPAVVRVDFQCGRNRDGIGTHNGRNMTAFRLDASADGINWDNGLVIAESIEIPETFPKWDSDGTSTVPDDSVRKDKGRPLSGDGTASTVSANKYAFSSVGAVSNGVIKVFGNPLEVSGLTIDASLPSGVITNFAFKASGTIDVLNARLEDGESLELPGDYSHIVNISNVSRWSVSLNGDIIPSKFIAVKNGKLSINNRGLRVIVR
ncbi:MAG: autotransporter-associated beta strand repeat-containing protein [Kiritimatiellae bacterium]|nr:autotransporter-associated beta strand repeat-containing protein [Kiritimatiellia bacterium]